MMGSHMLDRSGTLAILLELYEGDARFTDIQDRADISPTTLTDRLKRGKEEEMWEERLEEVPGGSARRVYSLLPRGRSLAEEAAERDIPELMEKQAELEAEYEQQIDEMKESQTTTESQQNDG